MLDVHADGEHTGETVLQFFLQGFFLVRIVAVPEDSGDGEFFRSLRESMNDQSIIHIALTYLAVINVVTFFVLCCHPKQPYA